MFFAFLASDLLTRLQDLVGSDSKEKILSHFQQTYYSNLLTNLVGDSVKSHEGWLFTCFLNYVEKLTVFFL